MAVTPQCKHSNTAINMANYLAKYFDYEPVPGLVHGVAGPDGRSQRFGLSPKWSGRFSELRSSVVTSQSRAAL